MGNSLEKLNLVSKIFNVKYVKYYRPWLYWVD